MEEAESQKGRDFRRFQKNYCVMKNRPDCFRFPESGACRKTTQNFHVYTPGVELKIIPGFQEFPGFRISKVQVFAVRPSRHFLEFQGFQDFKTSRIHFNLV
jgi:hypothetical protein